MRYRAAAFICVAVSVMANAIGSEATRNPEFWLWLSEYTTESGEVFDPLDLATIENLSDAEIAEEQSHSGETASEMKTQYPSNNDNRETAENL